MVLGAALLAVAGEDWPDGFVASEDISNDGHDMLQDVLYDTGSSGSFDYSSGSGSFDHSSSIDLDMD